MCLSCTSYLLKNSNSIHVFLNTFFMKLFFIKMVNCLKVQWHPSITFISLKNVSFTNYRDFFSVLSFHFKESFCPLALLFLWRKWELSKQVFLHHRQGKKKIAVLWQSGSYYRSYYRYLTWVTKKLINTLFERTRISAWQGHSSGNGVSCCLEQQH